jgi:O-antigen/teichoic acid export membrane protein
VSGKIDLSGADLTAPHSIRRNFSWVLAGNGSLAASQWLALVLMAKIGSAEMVGQFSLALAIAMPVIAMTNLQIRTLQSTDAKHEFTFGDYFGARLLTAVLGLLIVLVVVATTDYSPAVDGVVIVLTLARTLDSLSDVPYGLLQQRERMDRIGISLGLHGILGLAAFAGALGFTGSLFAATTAMAVTSGFLLIVFDLPGTWRHIHGRSGTSLFPAPSLSRGVFQRIAWLGLPISFVTAINSLTGNVPRYFLAENHGDRELGIFSALFYLTVAGGMMMGAISDPASPRLAKLAAAKDGQGFRSLLGKLVLIAMGVATAGLVVAVAAGKPLLAIIYRPEYAEYSLAFVWLMAAAIPAYVAGVLGVGVNSLRRFHAQVPLPVVNLVITGALAAFLIPAFGVTGAGQVVFAGATLSMVTTAVLLAYCLRTSFGRNVI